VTPCSASSNPLPDLDGNHCTERTDVNATPVYTKAEKAKKARLLLKGAKGAYADTSKVERELDRIDEAARERGRREAEAHQRALSAAKDEVAAARVLERSAPRGPERQTAREARRAAEKRLRLVERAAR
jgi:secreted protein with Ig-like and vWFA domain